MVKRLIEMIKHFQSNVLEAASLFEKYKGISQDKLSRSRFEGLAHDGFLDSEQTIEYYFHGIGLCVTFPDRTIDWDFGYNGSLDGFDLWRLWIFVTEGTDQFPEFKAKKALEKAFKEAEIQGIIQKRFRNFQDELYYFSSNQ